MMKYFATVLIFILVFQVYFPHSLSQMQCVRADDAFHFWMNEKNFLGTVAEINPSDTQNYNYVTFDILYPLKGLDDQSSITVATYGGGSYGYDFQLGSNYVVNANKRLGVDYFTDLCSGNKLLSTEKDINEIKSQLLQITSIPPLKLTQYGLAPHAIKCKENLVLVQKYDESPACVKPETKIKLIERGWTEKNQIKTTVTPFCKQPLYVLDLETNTCITNQELPKCTDSTSLDSSIQNCRVSVTCDKEFDSSTTDIDVAMLPECKPLQECPEGFLFAIFPVDGGDALCEREERNMHFGIFHPLDQRMLNSTDFDFSQEKTIAKPVDLNGSEEERTIQIIVIMSGWYEKLGSPIAIIESNSEQIEQVSLDLQKNQPGQAIHGFDYVIPENLPDGKITLTIQMSGYDAGSPQSFHISHIPK